MVSEINADAERMGVVMTFEEEVRHINRKWQNKLDEKDALLGQKDALLKQNAVSLEQKDALIADLQRQIEDLKAKA